VAHAVVERVALGADLDRVAARDVLVAVGAAGNRQERPVASLFGHALVSTPFMNAPRDAKVPAGLPVVGGT
jgi:hypothetical protein